MSQTTPPTRKADTPLVDALPQAEETTGIARAAVIIGLGNVASRILGLIREQVKANLFGAGALVDAFTIATLVPRNLHDLLIGGMVDSALVPVFSDLAEHDRSILWELVNALIGLSMLVLAAVVLVVELFAPQVITLLTLLSDTTLPPEFTLLATQLLRITTPAVMFLSLSGIMVGLLYALKRFTLPAFAVAVFNAGIVVVTVAFHNRLDINAMALGWLIGAVLQVALLVPGLRGTGFRLMLRFWHPALKRIVMLYIPILAGLAVEIIFVRPITYGLALGTGESGLSWLNYATNIRQLPQGLVGIAISFAILPTLSQFAAAANRGEPEAEEAFRRTLARGLGLSILLMVPATAGLALLGRPTIDLLFEHGAFTSFDTLMTTIALHFYLIGLPFAAVDLLLVFAFYARQNTLTPALIGIGTNIAYVAAAFILIEPLGLFGLMLADSFKLVWHAGVSAYLLRREIGGLSAYGIRRTILITGASVMLMAGSVLGVMALVRRFFPLPANGLLFEVALVALPSLIGAVVYVGLALLLGAEELLTLYHSVRARFTGESTSR
jgi:putative peptidoglycan lipid II flippase